ncbi:FeoA family protein [Companilactobacillus jidongensis]|uniref:FeoA family protein n=1 Tax=Companilactobacillus jidongensis TaxID=2486006 RepID=UPI001CDD4D12|nr:FeoA family protein [Companilactobacillus jidongensis]
MQLMSDNVMNKSFDLCNIEQLDTQTAQRLHSLGIHDGSLMSVVRFFPMHGPVIVEIEQQQIGIRYKVFKLLCGGQLQ